MGVDVLWKMEGKKILIFVCICALKSVDEGEGVLVLELFVEACGSEVEHADRLLFFFVFLQLFDSEVMLDIVLTFLIGKDLEVAKLSDLFHFFPVDLILALFFLNETWFVTVGRFLIDFVLHLVEPLVEDGTIFEFIGDVASEVCEIGCIEGPVDLVFFLAVISEES
jgi:hypothetical protein